MVRLLLAQSEHTVLAASHKTRTLGECINNLCTVREEGDTVRRMLSMQRRICEADNQSKGIDIGLSFLNRRDRVETALDSRLIRSEDRN